jgi:hypothetical protein
MLCPQSNNYKCGSDPKTLINWAGADTGDTVDILNRIVWSLKKDGENVADTLFSHCWHAFTDEAAYQYSIDEGNLCKMNNVLDTSFVKHWGVTRNGTIYTGNVDGGTLAYAKDQANMSLVEWEHRISAWRDEIEL